MSHAMGNFSKLKIIYQNQHLRLSMPYAMVSIIFCLTNKNIRLFDSIGILIYGSEILGFYKSVDIEKVHLIFLN